MARRATAERGDVAALFKADHAAFGAGALPRSSHVGIGRGLGVLPLRPLHKPLQLSPHPVAHPGEEIGQRKDIARGARPARALAHRLDVLYALLLGRAGDYCKGKAAPHEDKVHQQARHPSIPVVKRVNSDETAVGGGGRADLVDIVAFTQRVHGGHIGNHRRWDVLRRQEACRAAPRIRGRPELPRVLVAIHKHRVHGRDPLYRQPSTDDGGIEKQLQRGAMAADDKLRRVRVLGLTCVRLKARRLALQLGLAQRFAH